MGRISGRWQLEQGKRDKLFEYGFENNTDKMKGRFVLTESKKGCLVAAHGEEEGAD